MVLAVMGNGLINRGGWWWSPGPSPSHPALKQKFRHDAIDYKTLIAVKIYVYGYGYAYVYVYVYFHFKSSNCRSEPFNIIFILKYAWR